VDSPVPHRSQRPRLSPRYTTALGNGRSVTLAFDDKCSEILQKNSKTYFFKPVNFSRHFCLFIWDCNGTAWLGKYKWECKKCANSWTSDKRAYNSEQWRRFSWDVPTFVPQIWEYGKFSVKKPKFRKFLVQKWVRPTKNGVNAVFAIQMFHHFRKSLGRTIATYFGYLNLIKQNYSFFVTFTDTSSEKSKTINKQIHFIGL